MPYWPTLTKGVGFLGERSMKTLLQFLQEEEDEYNRIEEERRVRVLKTKILLSKEPEMRIVNVLKIKGLPYHEHESI